jgi:putative transposase
MTSNDVAALLVELQITRSHSRPKVSNDNPYSEAAFKTLKYCPIFPDRFGGIDDARAFCEAFFTFYKPRAPPFRHRAAHARIRPFRHRGRDPGPARRHAGGRLPGQPRPFRTKPVSPTIPAKAWINDPDRREKQAQNN